MESKRFPTRSGNEDSQCSGKQKRHLHRGHATSDPAADTALSAPRVAVIGTGLRLCFARRSMWDARDNTVVLDFNVNISAKCANVESVNGGPEIEKVLRKIHDVTSPAGGSSHGEASLVKGSLKGAPQEIWPSPLAPTPMTAPVPTPELAPAPAPSGTVMPRTTRPAPRSEPFTYYVHTRRKSATARRDTQQHNPLGKAFRKKYAAQIAVVWPLYQGRDTKIAEHQVNASHFSQ